MPSLHPALPSSLRRFPAVLLALAVVLTGLVALTPTALTPAATAAECQRLGAADLAFDSPALTGTVESGGVCFELDQPAGTVLRAGTLEYATFTLTNAAGETLCRTDRPAVCTLTGEPPYRFQTSGGSYALQVFRVNQPVGCPEVRAGGFGSAAAAPLPVDLAVRATDCRVVDLPAGPVLVSYGDDGAWGQWVLYDAAGATVCSGDDAARCEVPSAGRYALVVADRSSSPRDWRYTAGLVLLTADTPGCDGTLSTSWAGAPRQLAPDHTRQAHCHPLDAASGDRLDLTVTASTYGAAQHLVVDDAGRDACVAEAGHRGCRLDGAGPFRLVSYLADKAADGTSYTVAARNLTTLEGCPRTAVTPFGTAPGDGLGAVPCRALDLEQAAGLLVAGAGTVQVVAAGGRVVCEAGCRLERGRYAVLTAYRPQDVLVHDLTSGAGCRAGGDSVSQVMAGMAADGRHDCSLLPTPSGATVATVTPAGAYAHPVRYFDADGVRQCASAGSHLLPTACLLDGEAPFRAVVHAETGRPAYRAAVVRIDEPACAPLPAGPYGTTQGAEVTLGSDGFAACLKVPTGDLAAKEVLAAERTAGGGKARLVALTPASSGSSCATGTGERVTVTCATVPMTGPATPYLTVLAVGDGADASFQVVRRPLGAAAAGCRPVDSTEVGDAATSGRIDSYVDIDCYTVEAAETDRFLVSLHSGTREGGLSVYSSTGSPVCDAYPSSPCVVGGRDGYQVLVRGRGLERAVGDYDLEPSRFQTAAGFSDACTELDDYRTGFGPVEGTLGSDSPVRCLVVRDSGWDTYTVDRVNTAGGAELPVLTPLSARHGDSLPSCRSASGGVDCSGFAHVSSSQRWRGLLLLTRPGSTAAALPYRVTADCAGSECGHIYEVTGASPDTVRSGGRVTVTVTGGQLSPSSTVRLVRDGHPAVVGTPRSGPVRSRSLTVDLDLAGAPAGDWRLEVVDGQFGTAALPGSIHVEQAPLRSTSAPRVTGEPRVAGTVSADPGAWSPSADTYAYQWLLDGEPVEDATEPTFALLPEHQGRQLSVAVTARRAGYFDGTATSAAATVLAGYPPQNRKAPRVKGKPVLGNTLKAVPGRWSPRPTSYSFQWYRDNRKVRGAKGRTVKLTKRWNGKAVHVRVTAHRTGHLSLAEDSRRKIVRKRR